MKKKHMEQTEFNLQMEVNKLVKAIEDEVDWFIARIQAQDPYKRELYHTIWLRKRGELKEIVKEVCENLK